MYRQTDRQKKHCHFDLGQASSHLKLQAKKEIVAKLEVFFLAVSFSGKLPEQPVILSMAQASSLHFAAIVHSYA